jgi:hypothetical protein
MVGKDDAEVLYPDHCNEGDDGDAWFDESPSEADRNLIAAAPDMYEALELALEELEGIVDAGDWHSDSLAILAIRQAINKARKVERD